MSPQREAQPPSTSSEWLRRALRVGTRLAPWLFISLLLLHLACQAASAAGPRMTSRWHESPVWGAPAAVLWLVALSHVVRSARRSEAGESDARERALSFAERGAAWVVLGFALAHGARFAWQLLSAELYASDLRPYVLASLSQSTFGMPLISGGYLCAVGCASFLLTRFAARQPPFAGGGRFAGRAAIALGLCSCALGVYAVVRFAAGSLVPW